MANVLSKIRTAIGRRRGAQDESAMTTSITTSQPIGSLKERLDARFEAMMREVDELSNSTPTIEEQAEYGWIVGVRFLLPLVFFLAFGYEDGLFMTGFRYLDLEPFVLIMYVIGYGLEGLRTAMVYSMNFSKTEGRKQAYRHQFIFWVVMSLGCGIAQLASALVIQALGADQAVVGNNAVAHGASVIMAHIPFLVYVAIAVRVGLCAIADWACSGHLHKRKETVEQKVAMITTKATNLQTVIQAQINAQTMTDNARHYQEIIADERSELKELRKNQKKLSDMVFRAGMQRFRAEVEEEAPHTPLLGPRQDEEEE
ncbi:MAG TPA: ABC transporter permease [Ktedonobacteraceae bacterium]|jgi:hypothetical protein|nr:ABC transporter permease [Ktedonobacteraceae bacterium]